MEATPSGVDRKYCRKECRRKYHAMRSLEREAKRLQADAR